VAKKAVDKFKILMAIVDGESWEPADVAELINSTPDYARRMMADLRRSMCRGSLVKTSCSAIRK